MLDNLLVKLSTTQQIPATATMTPDKDKYIDLNTPEADRFFSLASLAAAVPKPSPSAANAAPQRRGGVKEFHVVMGFFIVL